MYGCHMLPHKNLIRTILTERCLAIRIWVDLKRRVTYLVNRVIISMDQQRVINMDDDTTRFCVSYVLQQVCSVGMVWMI